MLQNRNVKFFTQQIAQGNFSLGFNLLTLYSFQISSSGNLCRIAQKKSHFTICEIRNNFDNFDEAGIIRFVLNLSLWYLFTCPTMANILHFHSTILWNQAVVSPIYRTEILSCKFCIIIFHSLNVISTSVKFFLFIVLALMAKRCHYGIAKNRGT